MPEDLSKVLDIPLAGMWVTGDLATAPGGTTPMCKNIVTRPGGEFYVREKMEHSGPPPLGLVPSYYPDGILEEWPRFSYKGAAFFEQDSSKGTPATPNIWVYLQNRVSLEYSWAKVVTGFPSSVAFFASDGIEYKGLMCFAALRTTEGNPSSIDALKLTGTNLTTPEYVSHILNGGTEIAGKVLGVFGNRLIMANTIRTITNLIGKTYGANAMFGIGPPPWVATGVSYSLPSGATPMITPTVTTGEATYQLADVATFTTSQPDFFVTADLFNRDPVNAVPMTIEAYISGADVARSTAYAKGVTVTAVASDSKPYLYVCSVAGTTAASAPVYPPAKDATIVDGGATFKNIGSSVISKFEITLPPAASDTGTWIQAAMQVNYAPASGQAAKLGVRYRFGTDTETTWPLATVQIGYKDGKSTGDPTKASKGIQVIVGTIPAMFVPSDTTYVATEPDTQDVMWWTEPDSFDLFAYNFSKLNQYPGEITGVCAPIAGRMIVYKTTMCAVYQLGSDPNFPFIEERVLVEYGCVNNRAWDVFDDVVYSIGLSEVYAFDGSGMPNPLAGPAMRDALFPSDARVLRLEEQRLGIDREKREVHVTTRADYIFVYNIDTKQWSVRSAASADSINPEFVTEAAHVGDLTWVGGKFFMVSSPAGIQARADSTNPGYDTDQRGLPQPVLIEYWLPQLTGPAETMALVEKLHLHYRSSAYSNFSIEKSYDGGASWTTLITGTSPPAKGIIADYIQIPVWESGGQVWFRIIRAGPAGRAEFRMVGLRAYVQLMGESIPAFNATFQT